MSTTINYAKLHRQSAFVFRMGDTRQQISNNHSLSLFSVVGALPPSVRGPGKARVLYTSEYLTDFPIIDQYYLF